jgi:hypothetical protein
LLAAFLAAAQGGGGGSGSGSGGGAGAVTEEDVLYLEAHAWSNA